MIDQPVCDNFGCGIYYVRGVCELEAEKCRPSPNFFRTCRTERLLKAE